MLLEDLAHAREHGIAGGVAVAIVDRLEVIEIGQRERDACALAHELMQRLQRRDPSAEDLLPALKAALTNSADQTALAALERELGAYDFKGAAESLQRIVKAIAASP